MRLPLQCIAVGMPENFITTWKHFWPNKGTSCGWQIVRGS
jgi:hypothetical protein